jgi:hypothetical protein
MFKGLGADTAQVAVPASSIVEHFDVIEDIFTGQITCFVDALLDPFFLQTTKKGLDNGVIPAVTPAAHTGLEIVRAAEA